MQTIPNPKRTFTVDFSKEHVFTRLHWIGAWTNKNNQLSIVEANLDRTIGHYRFKCFGCVTGFVTLGEYGDVFVTEKGENKCEITIEMRKVSGSIEDSADAYNIELEITNFISLLSRLLNMPEEQLQNYPKYTEKELKKERRKAKIGNFCMWVTIGSIALMFFAIWFG